MSNVILDDVSGKTFEFDDTVPVSKIKSSLSDFNNGTITDPTKSFIGGIEANLKSATGVDITQPINAVKSAWSGAQTGIASLIAPAYNFANRIPFIGEGDVYEQPSVAAQTAAQKNSPKAYLVGNFAGGLAAFAGMGGAASTIFKAALPAIESVPALASIGAKIIGTIEAGGIAGKATQIGLSAAEQGAQFGVFSASSSVNQQQQIYGDIDWHEVGKEALGGVTMGAVAGGVTKMFGKSLTEIITKSETPEIAVEEYTKQIAKNFLTQTGIGYGMTRASGGTHEEGVFTGFLFGAAGLLHIHGEIKGVRDGIISDLHTAYGNLFKAEFPQAAAGVKEQYVHEAIRTRAQEILAKYQAKAEAELPKDLQPASSTGIEVNVTPEMKSEEAKPEDPAVIEQFPAVEIVASSPEMTKELIADVVKEVSGVKKTEKTIRKSPGAIKNANTVSGRIRKDGHIDPDSLRKIGIDPKLIWEAGSGAMLRKGGQKADLAAENYVRIGLIELRPGEKATDALYRVMMHEGGRVLDTLKDDVKIKQVDWQKKHDKWESENAERIKAEGIDPSRVEAEISEENIIATSADRAEQAELEALIAGVKETTGVDITKPVSDQITPSGQIRPELQAPMMKELFQEKGELFSGEHDAPAKTPASTEPSGKIFGSGNTVFTKEMKDAAEKSFKDKTGGLHANIDPTAMADLVKIGGYYIEGGIRDFKAFSEKMIEDFGDSIKPYIKQVWDEVQPKLPKPTVSESPTMKTRGLSESVEDSAINKKLVKGIADLPTYEVRHAKDISDFIENNYDKAKQIAFRELPEEGNIRAEELFTAIRIKAEAEGDVNTIRDLATNEAAASAGTELGQRIQALDASDPNSPVTAIKDVQKTRVAEAEGKIGKDKLKAEKKSEVAKIKKSMKAEVKKLDWEGFLSSLEC